MRQSWKLFLFGLIALWTTAMQAADQPLKLLYLGDNGHHQPRARFGQLQPVLAKRGIQLAYTDVMTDLNPETLGKYAGLVVYANIDTIEEAQAKALLEYVASGKGFIPLHCASYCFRNNAEVVALMGGQFLRHGTGTFRVQTTEAGQKHPLMSGYKGFESWDETYVHTKHNEKDRTVLEVRAEGDGYEPWTWVRTHGKGRVFYTAWGHDDRTFGNPGFQNLVERGIRWACGDDASKVPAFAERPEMTPLRKDVKPFEYVDANIPFYPPGRGAGQNKGPRQMQLPLAPEESAKHNVTPEGFEAKLYASEPMIGGKPLAMNWDERGRLWLCESVDYPNDLQPQGSGHDRIRVLEDTNGDGVADKSTVFAEKLTIPTAIVFYRGGIIVQDGRETIYLKDTNGDDRADIRKLLITGWGMGDTHGGVSNFQYGLDNWYYGMQGYNYSEPTYDDGKKKATAFRMGFFRFKVAGEGEQTAVKEVEFLRSTNNNTWGLGISEEGLIFGSTANGNPSEFMPIPNRYYEAVRGWSSMALNGIADSNKFEALNEDKVRQVDHHGGFTAAAGHALYTARNYPKEYWNRAAFVTEPTGHLVATFIIRQDGSGFRSKNSWNLLASDDEWTAPIMAEVGPDGNVWVIDWYNYIVQHNPTPAGFKTGKGNAYESELRDKKHGRIYRVVFTEHEKAVAAATKSLNLNPDANADDAAMMARPADLRTAASEQLARELGSANMFWRRHAQRLIVESPNFGSTQQLIEIINDQAIDEIGLNAEITHALWALHGRGVLDGQNSDALKGAIAALKHPSAGVRLNAVKVLPRDEKIIKAIVASGICNDKAPQVQLAAFLALAELPPSAEAAEQVRAAFGRVSSDRWLNDALVSAAAKHDTFFLRAVASQASSKQQPPPQSLQIVAEHYARSAPAQSVSTIIDAIAKAEANETSAPVIDAIIAGISKGWPKNSPVKLSEASEKALVKLVTTAPPNARAALVNLSARWGSKALEAQVTEIAKGFMTTAADPKAKDGDRVAAAKQLVEFRKQDAEVSTDLIKLITPKSSVELSAGLIEAIGGSDAVSTGTTIVGQLPVLTPSVRPIAFRVLLSRADWTKALIEGLETGKLQASELSLEQKQGLAAHPDKSIASRAQPLLAKGGGLPNPDRQKVIDELRPVIEKQGDAVAGKVVFKKTCTKCHTHSGEGTKIGPDLTGMAVHPKHELLIHIIDPSRSVEGNFRIYTVVTDDGKVLSGLLASESKTAIEVIDVEAKRHTVLRENIDELIASTKSLMPEGFEKTHTQQELVDLMEFLTQRGKFLPIPLEKYATIVTTKGMFNSEDAGVERLIFDDWKPKIFDGVPFVLVDPQGTNVPNAVMLYGTAGNFPRRMPKQVTLPCNSPAKLIHFLGGISGWGWPASEKGTNTVTVRLTYADGQTEDHALKNGQHFADYIRRVDVEGSKFAYPVRGQQVRYFSITPARAEKIATIDLIKGNDITSPVFMAITVEGP